MTSSTMSKELLCRRCGRAITAHPELAETFEGMHWLCFHLEYEHAGDPDVPCADASCPWRQIEFYRQALARAGIEPSQALDAAMSDYYRGFGR